MTGIMPSLELVKSIFTFYGYACGSGRTQEPRTAQISRSGRVGSGYARFYRVGSQNLDLRATQSMSTKIRNENPASTGSLAGSKRFFLHSICLARARTNKPATNLLYQSRQVDIDAAGSRPGFRQKMSKAG